MTRQRWTRKGAEAEPAPVAPPKHVAAGGGGKGVDVVSMAVGAGRTNAVLTTNPGRGIPDPAAVAAHFVRGFPSPSHKRGAWGRGSAVRAAWHAGRQIQGFVHDSQRPGTGCECHAEAGRCDISVHDQDESRVHGAGAGTDSGWRAESRSLPATAN